MPEPPTTVCEYLDGCPVFKHFKKYAIQVYIDAYCQGEYATCKRYQLRTAGETVPQDLLPTGCRLWSNN